MHFLNRFKSQKVFVQRNILPPEIILFETLQIPET